jgi:hypothetical protein
LGENFDRFNFAIHKEKEMADFRKWFLALAMLVVVLGSVAPASAQNVVCTVAPAVIPNLRQEGFTELTGDILLSCVRGPSPAPTGGTAPQASISVTYSAPITSRIMTAGNAAGPLTDAVLTVDDPSPANQLVCGVANGTNALNPVGCLSVSDGLTYNTPTKYNVFQGQKTQTPSVNSITFYGVPVDAPMTSRTYRISNVRVDATVVPGGVAFLSPVYAFVSTGSSTSILVSNQSNGNYVGYVSQGLLTSASGTNPPFLQCQSYGNTVVGSVTFQENFVTAFKLQGANASTTGGSGSGSYPQNTPGTVYYTESGLEIAVTGGESGVADSPTELQTTISNIPAGVVISVDNWALSTTGAAGCTVNDGGQTICTTPSDATMILPVSSLPDPWMNTVTAVTDGSESSVQVVWAITNTNPQATDTLTFNIYASFTGAPGTPGSPATGVQAGELSSFYPTLPAANYAAPGPFPSFSSTKDVGTTPTSLFTVSLCQTILLFPYVTDFYGFDTGIAISNTSSDPLGATGASPQTGACSVNFYGTGASNLGTSGVYSSTADTTLTTGLIPSGTTWAFSLSGIDPGYNSTPSYGLVGYAIAICNFQYGHGYSFVSDTGIRNFAAAYLALIIPDAPRAPQPFICSANGGACSSETGEQLVH